jgi:chromosome segregation ATPase
VPCPTPTAELDRLRSESEQLERDLDRAAREERALRVEREDAARRIAAAESTLDSLANGRTP